MCQCDTNDATQGHYTREKVIVRDTHKGQYIRDGLYEQGFFVIEHGRDMINSWDSYWAKLRERYALSIKNNLSFQSVLSD